MINYEAQKHATQHILDAVNSDGFDGCAYYNECKTDADKAHFLYERFMSEYGWRVKQVGEQKALIDWLQGLAINIAFYNSDILMLAKQWGSLPVTATEKQEDAILENYWNYMAMRIVVLWNKYKCRAKVTA